jgi:hypothetical protein
MGKVMFFQREEALGGFFMRIDLGRMEVEGGWPEEQGSWRSVRRKVDWFEVAKENKIGLSGPIWRAFEDFVEAIVGGWKRMGIWTKMKWGWSRLAGMSGGLWKKRWERKADRKGYDRAGGDIGKNHTLERGGIGHVRLGESHIQLWQGKGWWVHDERNDRKDGNRKPNQGRCSILGVCFWGDSGNVLLCCWIADGSVRGVDAEDIEESGKVVPEGGNELGDLVRSYCVWEAKTGNPRWTRSYL